MTAVNNVKCGLWSVQDLKCHLSAARNLKNAAVLSKTDSKICKGHLSIEKMGFE